MRAVSLLVERRRPQGIYFAGDFSGKHHRPQPDGETPGTDDLLSAPVGPELARAFPGRARRWEVAGKGRVIGPDPGVQHADDHARAQVGPVPRARAPQTQELRRASGLQRDELVGVGGEESVLHLHRRQVLAGQTSGETADDVLVGVEQPLLPGVNGVDRQERPVISFPALRIPAKM